MHLEERTAERPTSADDHTTAHLTAAIAKDYCRDTAKAAGIPDDRVEMFCSSAYDAIARIDAMDEERLLFIMNDHRARCAQVYIASLENSSPRLPFP